MGRAFGTIEARARFFMRKRYKNGVKQLFISYIYKCIGEIKCHFSTLKTRKNGTCLHLGISFLFRAYTQKSGKVTLNVTLNFIKR